MVDNLAKCYRNALTVTDQSKRVYTSIYNVVFSMSPTRLSEAGIKTYFFRASSATATVLGRGPDMRRNVPTTPLLAPQPKA